MGLELPVPSPAADLYIPHQAISLNKTLISEQNSDVIEGKNDQDRIPGSPLPFSNFPFP